MSLDPRDRALETMLRHGPRSAEVSPDCLDAESIAAWAEGGLDAAALARAEAHVADCARCQAVMATLAQAPDESISVPQHSGSPARRWWHLDMRWLLPLAGAATAALLWAVVPSSPPSALSDEAAQSPPAATEAAPSQNAIAMREREAPQPAPVQEEGTKDQLARGGRSPQRAGALEKQARGEPAPPATAKESAGTRAEATVAAPERSADAPPAPAAPALAGASAEADTARNRGAFARIEPTIPSRDTSVQWRVRSDGVIERSVNSGATWAPTDGRAEGAVVAGASPSADVCWLVGRAGFVMVTGDGPTWRRATAPTTEDIVSIEALDARQATVRTAAGASYRTTDGGLTWTP